MCLRETTLPDGGGAGQSAAIARRDFISRSSALGMSVSAAAATLAVYDDTNESAHATGPAAPLEASARSNTVIFDMDTGPIQSSTAMNPYSEANPLRHGLEQAAIEPLFILNYGTGKIEPWLGERPGCFWWEGLTGERLLVWNNEVYMAGNWALGFPDSPSFAGLERHLAALEEHGYPYDTAIIPLQGYVIDNAAPNMAICTMVEEFNRQAGRPLCRLVTLGEALRDDTDLGLSSRPPRLHATSTRPSRSETTCIASRARPATCS